ncbi:MAG: S1C family serine protease [Halorhodospira sp.]
MRLAGPSRWRLLGRQGTAWLRFLVGYTALGVALALAIVWLKPSLLGPLAPRVEVNQTQAQAEPASSPGSAASAPASYADAVARAAPAVVNIFTVKQVTERLTPPGLDTPLYRHFFGEPPTRERQRTETSLGSGVIVAEDGYVVTNHHVIDNAEQIQVLLADGRQKPATVVGRDPATDLAVLRIDATDLPVITFADDDRVRVGDVALAIGNPFGVGQTVTQGIISATGRDQLGLSTFENFIQTDAAINPGNSGGALIDAQGSLVGINTAIFSDSGGSQGIGFAIPAGIAQTVTTDLIEHGRVVRGWLGVQAQRLTPALAESFGVAPDTEGIGVTDVFPGGPADQAGIQQGDVITRLGDQAIRDVQDLLRAASRGAPGTELEISGYRDGDRFSSRITLGDRPEMAQPRQPGRR